MMLETFNFPAVFSIPESFRREHYCLDDLLRLLGLDQVETGEEAFWHSYKCGLIPHGCWLPSLERSICWKKSVIDQWIDSGFPANPGVMEHERDVLSALVKALTAEHPKAAAALFGQPETN